VRVGTADFVASQVFEHGRGDDGLIGGEVGRGQYAPGRPTLLPAESSTTAWAAMALLAEK
jgi:hypothetical protein